MPIEMTWKACILYHTPIHTTRKRARYPKSILLICVNRSGLRKVTTTILVSGGESLLRSILESSQRTPCTRHVGSRLEGFISFHSFRLLILTISHLTSDREETFPLPHHQHGKRQHLFFKNTVLSLPIDFCKGFTCGETNPCGRPVQVPNTSPAKQCETKVECRHKLGWRHQGNRGGGSAFLYS